MLISGYAWVKIVVLLIVQLWYNKCEPLRAVRDKELIVGSLFTVK